MPAFETPEPISVAVEFDVGTVRLYASDRGDTVVDVRPSDPGSDADIRAAGQATVEYAAGQLVVRTPRSRARRWFGLGGSIDVLIELPTGSQVDADIAADVLGRGRLGDCNLTTTNGDVLLEQAGRLRVSTSNGEIRVGRIDGSGTVKTSNGDIAIGQATGDVRLNTASGDITVDRALAGVDARTAYGSVRVSEAEQGSIRVETSYGDLEVGLRSGTAAWLDVMSNYGNVNVPMTPHDGPGQAEKTIEVRAHTDYGDVLIHRS
jgi:hypothetical protein